MSFLYGILPGVLISFGMGGGTLFIYIMNLFENYTQQKVQYINLWLFIFCSAFSVCMYYKNNKIDFKGLKLVFPITIVVCIISSYISKTIFTDTLKKYFGIFLIVIGIWQLFQIVYKYIKDKKADNKK